MGKLRNEVISLISWVHRDMDKWPKKQLKVENGHLWRMRHEKLDISVLLDWTVFHNKSCSTTWPIKLCMYQL